MRDIALAKKIAAAAQGRRRSRSRSTISAPAIRSFASLRDVPFAEIKIDASFVKNCATDATNAAICQTAIDLAHRFGSAAVAEGVESMADLQALMVMGCDFGQGVLVAPPMPKERFLDLLRQRAQQARRRSASQRRRGTPLPARPRRLSVQVCVGSANGERLALRRQHAEDVERHRDQRVIAEDADELDRRRRRRADRLHALDRCGRSRAASCRAPARKRRSRARPWAPISARVRRADRAMVFALTPALLGDRRVREPFVLRRQKRAVHRMANSDSRGASCGLVAAMGAERLRQLAEFRRVHPGRERAAHRQRLPARATAQRRQQRALRLAQLPLLQGWEGAARGALAGMDVSWAARTAGAGFYTPETGRRPGALFDRGVHARDAARRHVAAPWPRRSTDRARGL